MRIFRVLVNMVLVNMREGSALSRRHAERAVEPHDFAIEIAVLDHVAHQRGELRWLAEQFWKRHRGGQALLRGLGQRMQHRRREDSWRNGVDADAELGEF